MADHGKPKSRVGIGVVAATLKSLRNKAGLSVQQMADKIGMDKQEYYYYESRFQGDVLPSEKAGLIVPALLAAGVLLHEVQTIMPPVQYTKTEATAPRQEILLERILAVLIEIRDRLPNV